jgi:hypothetical protein
MIYGQSPVKNPYAMQGQAPQAGNPWTGMTQARTNMPQNPYAARGTNATNPAVPTMGTNAAHPAFPTMGPEMSRIDPMPPSMGIRPPQPMQPGSPQLPGPLSQHWLGYLNQSAIPNARQGGQDRGTFLSNITQNISDWWNQGNAPGTPMDPAIQQGILQLAGQVYDSSFAGSPPVGGGPNSLSNPFTLGHAQPGNPTFQNTGITNDVLQQLMQTGLNQRQSIFGNMTDIGSRLTGMPSAGSLLGSPDFSQMRSSIQQIADDDILRQAEQLVGNVPGMSTVPTGAMLTAAGLPFSGGDPNAPLRSKTGSITESFLGRGGTRANSGAYAGAVGEVLGEMNRQRALSGARATDEAMRLGLQGRQQDIDRFGKAASTYAATPTMFEPAFQLGQQAFEQYFRPWYAQEQFATERERIQAMLEAAGMPWEGFGGLEFPNPFAPPGAGGSGGGGGKPGGPPTPPPSNPGNKPLPGGLANPLIQA